MLRGLDRGVGGLVRAARWLALPVVALLFAQWPLREAIGFGSREANDFGQCAFALFVAVAVTAATRAGGHLTPDNLSARFRPGTRRALRVVAAAVVLLPFGLFTLFAGWPSASAAVRTLERFPETGNLGYFIVKASALLLAGLVAAQAAVDAVRRDRDA